MIENNDTFPKSKTTKMIKDTNTTHYDEDPQKSSRFFYGVSVYHLCTIFQPKVVLYASKNLIDLNYMAGV